MPSSAAVLTSLAAMLLFAGCQRAAVSSTRRSQVSTVLAADALLPSPRLIVGRVIAVDAGRGFAFIELAGDAPAGASTDGAELMTRTPNLAETARLRASRHLAGRTLGTKIVGGRPSPGDEVVWLAP